jgi:hypothetical protein
MTTPSDRSSGSGTAKKATAKKTASSIRTRTAPKDPLVESARQTVAAARTRANVLKQDGQKAQARAAQAAEDRTAVRIAADLKDAELTEKEQEESQSADELLAKAKQLTDILDPPASDDEVSSDEPAPEPTRAPAPPAKSDDTASEPPSDDSDTKQQSGLSWLRSKLV